MSERVAITSGTSFDFIDPVYGFGDFMTVPFSDTQVTLTNLVSGKFPTCTAASFEFASPAAPIGSVSIDSASSPLFAPGSVLTFTANSFHVNLSGTCTACSGKVEGVSPGESIILNITPVPEPSQGALMGIGLLSLTWRRRKTS